MTIRMQNVFLCGLAVMAGWASYTLLPAQEPAPFFSKTGKVGARIFINGNTVKGAPYSAEAVTESTQVLADGNRIVQTSKEKLYRDGQGRERREVSGPNANSVTISDPIAGNTLILNSQNQTAQKTPFFQINLNGNPTVALAVEPGAAGQTFVFEQDGKNYRYRVQNGEPGQAGVVSEPIPGGRSGPVPGGRGGGGRGGAPGIVASGRIITPGNGPAPNREDLGSKNVEGVIATGTRTTATIPAGQIGNQQAIQVVDEVWYSDEIKANVLTRHNDPRTGETVYRLTNIFRGEPDPSLFQAPSNYTVTEGPQLQIRKE